MAKNYIRKDHFNKTSLIESDVIFNCFQWTQVIIKLDGPRIMVFIKNNEKAVIDYIDCTKPFLSGKIGLQTGPSDVNFQNLQMKNENEKITIPIEIKEMPTKSAMLDTVNKNCINSKYSLDTINAFNGKNLFPPP